MPMVQFGLFNIGVIVQAIGVWQILSDNEAMAPVAGIGSFLLIISMALFAFLVYRHAKE